MPNRRQVSSSASPANASENLVLVVEDDPHSLELTAAFVREAGVTPILASSLPEALAALDRCGERIAFVISDIRLGAASGLDLFRRIRHDRPELPVVLTTAFANVPDAVDAMRDGAFYYFTKPVDFALLLRLLRETFEKRRLLAQVADLRARLAWPGAARIVGSSPRLLAVLDQAASVAATDTTVLLTGETGTGKDLLAEYIHSRSGRHARPLVALNCAALPEPLLESELFGHEKGAFTGAVSRSVGRFELAKNGTLFLDEIAELALPLQAKLLRVLETKQIEPLGTSRPITVDVRIVAGTNRDLRALVEAGRFRDDLFYRLDAFPIELPPLRERWEDVAPLTRHFLASFAASNGKPVPDVEPAALAALESYAWPGNVRELRHTIERAIILSTGTVIGTAHLPARLLTRGPKADKSGPGSLAELKALEHAAVRRALDAAGGNRTRAADRLGMTRNQLRYRLDKMGLR